MSYGNDDTAADLGRLLLRVGLGAMILLHGIAKIVAGPGFIVGLLAKAGLPSLLAWGVYVGEVVAPLLLIIGLLTRPAAAVVAINMLFAIWLVHMPELLARNKTGGWAIELQGMFLIAALAVMLLGAGRYSVGGANARLN